MSLVNQTFVWDVSVRSRRIFCRNLVIPCIISLSFYVDLLIWLMFADRFYWRLAETTGLLAIAAQDG